jgi:hypothetical protein
VSGHAQRHAPYNTQQLRHTTVALHARCAALRCIALYCAALGWVGLGWVALHGQSSRTIWYEHHQEYLRQQQHMLHRHDAYPEPRLLVAGGDVLKQIHVAHEHCGGEPDHHRVCHHRNHGDCRASDNKIHTGARTGGVRDCTRQARADEPESGEPEAISRQQTQQRQVAATHCTAAPTSKRQCSARRCSAADASSSGGRGRQSAARSGCSAARTQRREDTRPRRLTRNQTERTL